nr:hypothetical protein [Tanacetum cinerariifolium]
MQANLEEEQRITKQKDEEANTTIIVEWDNTQAMMDADYELATKLQEEERGELSIEEKSKLFVELINKRKKHFEMLRGEESRREPPTKGQKIKKMCTYLKNMAGFTQNQLKSTSYEEESAKKHKLDEQVKAEEDNDQREADIKMYIKIISDDEIAIDAIPLTTKPPIIVDWKIIKEGKISSYHLIRSDGSSKRYSSMIQMLQHIDREDLETLWKLVKAKFENTRPEEGHERELWGDLKVMFKADVESEVWRKLQGNKVTIWKLFSSCGVILLNHLLKII